MTDSADMTGHLPPLSACGCGWKGGRTRTCVLGHVRCPPPTGWQSIDNELTHDWRASHPRRERVAGGQDHWAQGPDTDEDMKFAHSPFTGRGGLKPHSPKGRTPRG